jgi:2-haloacid dehalogenase
MPIDWTTVRALTFDCYGTLIDWEAGLVRDLRAGLSPTRVQDELLLAAYSRAEHAVESRPPFRPYREVLRECLERVATDCGAKVLDPNALVRGLPSWPAFRDSREALATLGRRFRLCVVSNIDRDLFAAAEAALGTPFHLVVTADEVRSYKPAPAHLEEALRRLAMPREALVHVAQSLFHDIEPARAMGLQTVWVDRRAGRPGGATRRPEGAPTPDLVVGSLAELAVLALRP